MKSFKTLILIFGLSMQFLGCSPSNSEVTPIPTEVTPNTTPPVLPPEESDICTADELTQLESEIKNSLSTYATDADFSLKVVSNDDRVLEFNRGSATQNKVYESASSSKWITGTIILHYIQSSLNQTSTKPLTLDSHPQDFIGAAWPVPASDSLYPMTVRDLMSFTSGLRDETNCINRPDPDFETCAMQMVAANVGNGYIPGKVYYYSGVHLQVAGLMAIKARNIALGITHSTWQSIFNDFKANTGLFVNSQYDLPSTTNPRLAGGMHWVGNDYIEFLKKFSKGQILNSTYLKAQLSDQVGAAVIETSPANRGTGEDWHYGLGLWAECHSVVFNCENNIETFSSAGAYGAYPFLNVKHNFYGLVARQGALGTGMLGYYTYASVSAKVTRWATKNCAP